MATKRNSRSVRSRRGKGSIFENRIAWLSAIVIFLILVQLFVFRDEGLYSLLQLKKEIREMEAHIQHLEVEKAALESEKERLLSDPAYLEKIARERFRMAKPGEKVFHVVIDSKKPDEAP